MGLVIMIVIWVISLTSTGLAKALPSGSISEVLVPHTGPSRVQVIPRPAAVVEHEGVFFWGPGTPFVYDGGNAEVTKVIKQFCNRYTRATGAHLPTQTFLTASPHIRIVLLPTMDEQDTVVGGHHTMPTKRGSYILNIKPLEVRISAPEPAGIYYALQSLWQLLPPEVETGNKGKENWELPCVAIMDKPRFAWRGMHLDVSRHFFGKEEVKKFLDYMATYKFNVFHWHLTDDQGWRIEIKQYPKLTEVGSRRPKSMVNHTRDPQRRYNQVPHEGYYSHEDIKEIVAYAHDRYITVVPEIEMPGHAQAAIAAYPEFGSADVPDVMIRWGISAYLFKPAPATYKFLNQVLDEVLALFPSRFIHIGGDEAIKQQWRRNPEIQAHMNKLGLRNEDELQSHFVANINQYLKQHGRVLMGWDEILQGGLVPGTAVMSWRGIDGGRTAARAGHPVVMCPMKFCYLDFYQHNKKLEPLCIGGLTTLKKVYSFEPIPADLSTQHGKNIMGLQGNVWTEYMPTFRRVEEQIMPRMFAIAEVGWSPRHQLSWSGFRKRAEVAVKRLDRLGIAHGPVPAY